MSADLTCPECKGDGSIRGCWSVGACDCHGGRRLPELHEWDALVAERDWLRAKIEKPADVLNAHDAVTEDDAALWETSPGDALARAISGLLDDLSAAYRDMHAFARAALDGESTDE